MIVASAALIVRLLVLPFAYWVATNGRVRRANLALGRQGKQVEKVQTELIELLREARAAGMAETEATRAEGLIRTLRGPTFAPPAPRRERELELV